MERRASLAIAVWHSCVGILCFVSLVCLARAASLASSVNDFTILAIVASATGVIVALLLLFRANDAKSGFVLTAQVGFQAVALAAATATTFPRDTCDEPKFCGLNRAGLVVLWVSLLGYITTFAVLWQAQDPSRPETRQGPVSVVRADSKHKSRTASKDTKPERKASTGRKPDRQASTSSKPDRKASTSARPARQTSQDRKASTDTKSGRKPSADVKPERKAPRPSDQDAKAERKPSRKTSAPPV